MDIQLAAIQADFLAVAGAAITPSLLFAFVFNGLVSAALRRVQRAVLMATQTTETADVLTSDMLTQT